MYRLVLASSSPWRLGQLKEIGYTPDEVYPTNIDETPRKGESPTEIALRLSKEKGIKAAENFSNAFIIAADTVSCAGQKIIEKAETDEDVRSALKAFSGKRHIVHSSVTVVKVGSDKIEKISTKLVSTIIKFKKLSDTEIEEYVQSKEGLGKSGGCSIQKRGAAFIKWIKGSYPAVVGIPVCETKSMLDSMGYKNESTR